MSNKKETWDKILSQLTEQNETPKILMQELERMVTEFSKRNDREQVYQLVVEIKNRMLNDRKMVIRVKGINALAYVSAGLKNQVGQVSNELIQEIVKQILPFFDESEKRLKLEACNTLLNVIKCHLKPIESFVQKLVIILFKLAAEQDDAVQNHAKYVNQLLQENLSSYENFDVNSFSEFISSALTTNIASCKIFALNWIEKLMSCPRIDINPYIPAWLDGIFRLCECSEPHIVELCYKVLVEMIQFMKKIEDRPEHMTITTNILHFHSLCSNQKVRLLSLSWILKTIEIYGYAILIYITVVLRSIFSNFEESEENHHIRKVTEEIKSELFKLLDTTTSHENMDVVNSIQWNELAQTLASCFKIRSIESKLTCLEFCTEFIQVAPTKMLNVMDDIFSEIVENLAIDSVRLTLDTLNVIKHICTLPIPEIEETSKESSTSTVQLNKYFDSFLGIIMRMTNQDGQHILADNDCFIMRNLCRIMPPKEVYMAFSRILDDTNDISLICVMVDKLNSILLTAPELSGLRTQLQNISTPSCCTFFKSLFRCWRFNPVASISLCLLSRLYLLSHKITQQFHHIQVTLEILLQLDTLVNILESPVFTSLRLNLSDEHNRKYLLQTLHGILMILPQTGSFNMLKNRLMCVNQVICCMVTPPPDATPDCSSSRINVIEDTQFQHELFEIFADAQNKILSLKSPEDCRS